MPHGNITDSDLDFLEQLARAASVGPWSLGLSPTATIAEAVVYMTKSVEQGDTPQLWMVALGQEPAIEASTEPVPIVAYTGNGPTSEANARYLANVQPQNVLTLIAALRQAWREARAARLEQEV